MKKRKALLEAGDGELEELSFDDDPLSEVFGVDKPRSYCRSFSSTMSMKQAVNMKVGAALKSSGKSKLTDADADARMNQMQHDLTLLSKVSLKHDLL